MALSRRGLFLNPLTAIEYPSVLKALTLSS